MKTAEYLALDYNEFVTRWPRPETLGFMGNVKIGPIYQFSGLSIHTCPGSTEECRSVCYDAWSPRTFLGGEKLLVKPTWYTYLAANRPEDLYKQLYTEIDVYAPSMVRLHVGGDFFTVGQIEAWIKVAKKLPDHRFFGYTRSYRIPELLPALEELRKLPNVKIFASRDTQTGDIPEGWLWAALETLDIEDTSNAIPCPEQKGLVENCAKCKLCINTVVKKNIIFSLHGTRGRSKKK